MENKIAMIIPYFGKWPEWIGLYLYSCSRQKNIDWLFYTDCGIPQKVYPNTLFHEMSFEDYCELVSRRLSINFVPERPYKLCDLKVFYGIIHQNDLKNYEWWGFGDVDLVYGNLSLLINDKNLQQYDLLTTHVDRIAGHFTVIRKKSKYTRLCLSIPDWKEKLCDTKNFGLDENAFTRIAMTLKYKLINKLYYCIVRLFTSPNSKHYWYYKLDKLFFFWKSRILMQEFFTTFKPNPMLSCVYNSSNGDIVCPIGQISRIPMGGKLYLHFMCFKGTPYYKTKHFWKKDFYQIPDEFDFSKGAFVSISTDSIKILNKQAK